MFPNVPQSSLGILKVPQLPPPLGHPRLKNPTTRSMGYFRAKNPPWHWSEWIHSHWTQTFLGLDLRCNRIFRGNSAPKESLFCCEVNFRITIDKIEMKYREMFLFRVFINLAGLVQDWCTSRVLFHIKAAQNFSTLRRILLRHVFICTAQGRRSETWKCDTTPVT